MTFPNSTESPRPSRQPISARAAGPALAALLVALVACAPQDPPPGGNPAPAKALAAAPALPKIIMFYASPGLVALGDEVTICYGLEDADSVTIEPNLRELRPSSNRCFSHAPEKTRHYKLTAKNAAGEVSREFVIEVQPPAPPAKRGTFLITTFVSSEEKVPAGAAVTLCYALDDADSVTIDPPIRELDPSGNCFTVRMRKTTSFKLTAEGGGETESRELTVTVE